MNTKGIITLLRQARIRAFALFGELMEQWAIENVPIRMRSTGHKKVTIGGALISDFISTTRSSPAVGAFVIGNPHVEYASYVNDMRNVYWTRWGRMPSKDNYWRRALMFAYRLRPLCLLRAIRALGLDARLGQSAINVMNTYYDY